MKTSNILLTVALVAIAGLGINPVRQTMLEREGKHKQLSTQKEEIVVRFDTVKTRQKTVGNNRIPSSPEQIALVNDVNRIAKKTNLTLPLSWNFSFGKNSAVNAEQIGISFPITGRRQQILDFLKEVEQNPRFMGIKSFSITTDSSQEMQLTEMNVDLYAFFIEA